MTGPPTGSGRRVRASVHMSSVATVTALALLVCSLAAAGCAGERRRDGGTEETTSPMDTALVSAAETVLRFLRGEVPFEQVHAADTVMLRLAPEGGGTQVTLRRELLADPANWSVPLRADDRVLLVPPRALTELTTKPGVHFNCLEQPLASVAPDLAMLPHVGMKLTPPDPMSCLQSWNLTLVFDTTGGRPLLVAAVYDQWEW
jgi:hypothetical protein